jgi:hypothetical protein
MRSHRHRVIFGWVALLAFGACQSDPGNGPPRALDPNAALDELAEDDSNTIFGRMVLAHVAAAPARTETNPDSQPVAERVLSSSDFPALRAALEAGTSAPAAADALRDAAIYRTGWPGDADYESWKEQRSEAVAAARAFMSELVRAEDESGVSVDRWRLDELTGLVTIAELTAAEAP